MKPWNAVLMGTERKCRFFVTANLNPLRCERDPLDKHYIHMTHIKYTGVMPIEITWRIDPPYIVE